jgi:hypothetical protein
MKREDESTNKQTQTNTNTNTNTTPHQQFQMTTHLTSCCSFYVQEIQVPSNTLVPFHYLSTFITDSYITHHSFIINMNVQFNSNNNLFHFFVSFDKILRICVRIVVNVVNVVNVIVCYLSFICLLKNS